jgi:hypothetical protein
MQTRYNNDVPLARLANRAREIASKAMVARSPRHPPPSIKLAGDVRVVKIK